MNFEFIGKYFGFGKDLYEAEGWLSWQHLIFVTLAIIVTIFLAFFLSKKKQDKSREEKIKVLKVASIVMLLLEATKIILECFHQHDVWACRSVLPLFLCSIILFSLPIAAFTKGRVQEAAFDFTQIFGIIACLAGTYLAGNIFRSPILSFYVDVSVTTHCISGFASLYITLSKLSKMEKKNTLFVSIILLIFEVLALSVDLIQLNSNYQHNYMFLITPDGTPFSIVEKIAGGHQAIYTILVMLIYFVYLFLYILIYRLITKKKAN